MDRSLSPASSISSAERTAGHDTSCHLQNGTRLNDSTDDEALQMSLMDTSLFWARVSKLDSNTTSSALRDIFYHHGANEAFVAGHTDGKNRRIGFVSFDYVETRSLAIEKVSNFIPLRQSCPLLVREVTPADVLEELAQTKRASHNVPQSIVGKPLTISDMLDLTLVTPQNIAHAIQVLDNPEQTACQIFEEVRGATRQRLVRIVAALNAVVEFWPHKQQLRAMLFRSSIAGTISTHESQATARNFGSFLGLLFAGGFLIGDPLELIIRLLGGVVCQKQIEAICDVADECQHLPGNKQGLAMALSCLATNHEAHDVRQASARRLLSLAEKSTKSDRSIVEKQRNVARDETNLSKRKIDETKKRTVYLSRLSPHIPRAALLAYCSSFGLVNKVRVCEDRSCTLLYAFVEMDNPVSVSLMLAVERHTLCDTIIRVQPARAPIQDSVPSDALIRPNFKRLKNCTFGSAGTLPLIFTNDNIQ